MSTNSWTRTSTSPNRGRGAAGEGVGALPDGEGEGLDVGSEFGDPVPSVAGVPASHAGTHPARIAIDTAMIVLAEREPSGLCRETTLARI